MCRPGNAILIGVHGKECGEEVQAEDAALTVMLLSRALAALDDEAGGPLWAVGRAIGIRMKVGEGDSGGSGDRRDVVVALTCLPRTAEVIAALDAYFLLASPYHQTPLQPSSVPELERLLAAAEKGAGHILKEQQQLLGAVLRWAGTNRVRVEAAGMPSLGGAYDKTLLGLAGQMADFAQSVPIEGFARYQSMVLQGEEALIGTSADREKEQAALARMQQQQFNAQVVAELLIAPTPTQAPSQEPPPPLVLVLAPYQDVMFGYGLHARTEHLLRNNNNSSSGRVVSVLLNPSAADSLAPSAQLRLALAYGPSLPEQRPLADLLWYSRYPPVRLLTRPKNAISREGAKPEGEFSILGAF